MAGAYPASATPHLADPPPNTALAWPPSTGRQSADKPAGGFVQCPLDRLLLPWWLYQADRLSFFALRTYWGALD
jgi:hypothetical protein